LILLPLSRPYLVFVSAGLDHAANLGPCGACCGISPIAALVVSALIAIWGFMSDA